MNTFNEDDFKSYLVIECHLSKLTVAAYIGDIAHFYQTCKGPIPTKEDVITFLSSLANNEYTKRSISRKVSSLRIYFYFLKHKKQQTVPDIADVFKPNISLNLPKLMSQSSLDKALRYDYSHSRTPLRDQCIVRLLYYSGCRVSEVIGMKKNNVFSDHIVILGKGDKERIMPLANSVKEGVNAYLLNERKDSGSEWLFPGQKGKSITRQTATKILAELKQHCGITERLTPHTLRHMFATTLLDRGMDLREVQLLLGHASIKTTQIYTHLNKTKLRHVFNECHPLS